MSPQSETPTAPEWPLVSVVVVTYDRLDTLVPTVESFRRVCSYPRVEYLLCDDGSPRRVQERMRQLPFDRFLFAERNGGLGRNTNRGIAAARGQYILQLQDDWVCEGRGDFVERAVAVMDEHPELGMIRYREPPPQVEPASTFTSARGDVVRVFASGTHARGGEYAYSDNPHIKRRDFHEKLGTYREGVPMNVMEEEFCARVDRDEQTRIGFIEGCAPFRHIGDEHSYNPSVRKRRLKARLESSAVTRWLVRAHELSKRIRRGR
jgi:GT2 family glycosyltransferase